MQTKYARSRGKANILLWAFLKPSRPWWSWGGWHCRCCWRRAAGRCTWGPGCMGLCWAGCGSTLSPNQAGSCCHHETHKSHGETSPFPCIATTRGVFQMQRLLRGSEIYPSCLAQCWPWAKVEQRYGEMSSFLCYLLPRVTWICSLKWGKGKNQWIWWTVLDSSE